MQLECFNVDGNFKVPLAASANGLAESLQQHLAMQCDPEFATARAYVAVLVVPPEAPTSQLRYQLFHQDSKTEFRIVNVLLACEDDEVNVDFLDTSHCSIHRYQMKAGQGVLFRNHLHRGTVTRGVRIHIRFEFTVRCLLEEVRLRC